jgi:hypothetical protein
MNPPGNHYLPVDLALQQTDTPMDAATWCTVASTRILVGGLDGALVEPAALRAPQVAPARFRLRDVDGRVRIHRDVVPVSPAEPLYIFDAGALAMCEITGERDNVVTRVPIRRMVRGAVDEDVAADFVDGVVARFRISRRALGALRDRASVEAFQTAVRYYEGFDRQALPRLETLERRMSAASAGKGVEIPPLPVPVVSLESDGAIRIVVATCLSEVVILCRADGGMAIRSSLDLDPKATASILGDGPDPLREVLHFAGRVPEG